MPEISVIMPVYNGIATIGRAIESIQKQTVKDFEIVIVDDGSSDGTFEYVIDLATKDMRIRPVRMPKNGGPAAARNEGFRNATGTWLAIIDADDWIEPRRFELMLRAAQETQAVAVFDNMKFYDHVLKRIISQTYFGVKNDYMVLTAQKMLELDNPYRRSSIGFLQPIIRRDFLQQHKLAYDTSHRVGEDFLLQIEIILRGGKTIVIPEAGYVYVHLVSPTTRRKAPQSKTTGGVDTVVRASDELLAKYGSQMTDGEKRALMVRRSRFVTLYKGRAMLAAIDAKDYREAAKLVLARPQILELVIISFVKMTYARIRGLFF